MKMKGIVVLIVACILSMTGSLAEENSAILHAMSAAEVDLEMGESVTLSDTLTFSVPVDWVKMEEDASLEGTEYAGSDENGNSAALISMKSDQVYGSLQMLQKYMEQNGTSYTALTWHGMDMFHVNGGSYGQEGFETIFCVKEDGTLLIFGVLNISGDIMQSEKLLTDLTAIVHSLKLHDGAKLLSFDDAMPGDAAREKEQNRKENITADVIPWEAPGSGYIGMLPKELLRDGYTSVVNAGEVGESAYWAVKTDGTLHIVGSGEMDSRWLGLHPGVSSIPWIQYSEKIIGAVIHEGITYIADYTFAACPQMRTIEIGSSVNAMGDTGIWSSGVEEITVDPWNPVYTSVDGVLYSKDMSTLVCFPPRKEYDGFEIPLSVNIISSFSGNQLTSITIPEQVTEIGEGAFSYCKSLQEVALPSKLEKIEARTFDGASALKTVTIPESVRTIGEAAFRDCSEKMDVYYLGSRSQWNTIKIKDRNFSLMAATIHLPDGTVISAVENREFIWDTMTKDVTNRIGQVEREGTKIEIFDQKYELQIPKDWERSGSMYVGQDEEGNRAILSFEKQPFAGYSGNWSAGKYGAEVMTVELNGIIVNLVQNTMPFSEYVTVTCWDAENYYMFCILFDQNAPLQNEKLVDDAAYILGSFGKI